AGKHDLDDADATLTELQQLLPHLGPLAGADLRLWRLGSGAWQLTAGPAADAPRAPRAPGTSNAAFVAIPQVDGWFLEVVAADDARNEAAPSHLLQIISSVIRSGASVATLTDELASRYEEIDLLYSIG